MIAYQETLEAVGLEAPVAATRPEAPAKEEENAKEEMMMSWAQVNA